MSYINFSTLQQWYTARKKDTRQINEAQISSNTNKDGTRCGKYRVSGQRKKHLGKTEDNIHRRHLTNKNTKMDLGRAIR